MFGLISLPFNKLSSILLETFETSSGSLYDNLYSCWMMYNFYVHVHLIECNEVGQLAHWPFSFNRMRKPSSD